MKIFVSLDINNRITGWSNTKDNQEDKEVVVTNGHEVLNNPFIYKYENGRLIKDSDYMMDKLKGKKMNELNYQCESSILGYFKSIVDGVEYEFSYDMEAQSRFNGVASSFSLGMITDVEWTAHKDGERYRLTLTKDQFIKVAKAAFIHQDSNIVKYNELILTVKSAQTKEELDRIQW